ncbi:unnamed protein product [Caenorhabditis auriculariae]|uniref:Integrase zinc-binding domain-containing protein n=1 Tax=Caenorhabditis auriculariae TaxID=2777116 RepID=A0A8S1GYJ2_9PELO|nr:unnamed protein product [Caenorhabditis auriculariae]
MFKAAGRITFLIHLLQRRIPFCANLHSLKMMLNNLSTGEGNIVDGYGGIAGVDDLSRAGVTDEIAFDDDEDEPAEINSDCDGFGGMCIELYNTIVEYKRTGILPAGIDKRNDRSAPSHWRSRCTRFTLGEDQETLFYCNRTSAINDQPKIVVKKGEVRKVLERVHELIGHLGQKRTQIVVLRKLHWRSVRQDVRNFINMCDFCNQKKLEGRKIIKAPVDITSDNFDIEISVREGRPADGSRLQLNLVGYNEQDVRTAAFTRMTSYTFKETTSEYRSRYNVRDSAGPSSFRKQPYVKRERVNQYAVGYLVPYSQRGRNIEPEFIEIYDRPNVAYAENDDEFERVIEEEIVEPMGMENMVMSTNMIDRQDVRDGMATIVTQTNHLEGAQLIEGGENPVACDLRPTKRAYKTPSSSDLTVHEDPAQGGPSSRRFPDKKIFVEELESAHPKRRKKEKPSFEGMAGRYSLALNDTEPGVMTQADLAACYDPSSQSRPEMFDLPPMCLMPSVDPEVIQMQKELLARQLNLQRMQEKVLQAQYDASMRIPIARYSHVEQVPHIVEETIEVEHDLNVIDEAEDHEMKMRSYGRRDLQ